MKTKKLFLKKIAFPFVMIMLAVFLYSNNVKAVEETTKVVLSKEGQTVKVSINPEEGASIASFQIGLKIEASKASDIKNVTFNWADIGNAKLKRESYDKEKGILNLYVVTDAEQNTGTAINVGTIKIETNKNTQVSVSPISDKTTASSIAHNDTKVEAKAADKVTYTITTGNESTGDNNQGGSEKPGDNTSGGNQGNNNSSNQGGSTKPGNNNNGNTSGNGTGSNNQGGNNSGSGSQEENSSENDSDSENRNEEENKIQDEENDINEINPINNTLQNDSIATGTLPQTGEDGNFIWIWLIVAIVGLIIALLYAHKIVNKRDWRR